MASAKIIELDETNTCKICDNALAKYSCPRCNILYCSLTCYQAPTHLECSEEFYKENIVEELNFNQNTEEGRAKMLEVLKRTHESNKIPDPEEETEYSDFDDHFNKFSQFVDIDELDEVTDSDDDHFVDIAERLAGVNLDDAETVWDKLTEDERQDFVAFLKTEDVTKLIATWEPWWMHSSSKIEEVNDEGVPSYKEKCPKIVEIKDFATLTTKTPAPCVKNNLVNILSAYVFTARYFNGEHSDFRHEAVSYISAISMVLKKAQNFEDFDTAVKSVEQECVNTEWITADNENLSIIRWDLEKILQGPSPSDKNFYVLCALSDIHDLMESTLNGEETSASKFNKKFPNDLFPTDKLESKDNIKKYIKKVEYYLSYAKDCFSL